MEKKFMNFEMRTDLIEKLHAVKEKTGIPIKRQIEDALEMSFEKKVGE